MDEIGSAPVHTESGRGEAAVDGSATRRVPTKWIRAAVLLLGFVSVLAILVWWLPTPVRTVTVQRQELTETLVTTGRVRSASRAGIGAPLVGTVEQVLAREGQRVGEGDLLVTLEDAEPRAAAAEARANLAVAEAQLDRLRDVDHPSATASLESAALELRQRELNVERVRALLEAGAVSPQALEDAERAAEAARARHTAALATARSLGTGGADRLAAQAAIERAREAVTSADARLALTRVRSPAAGTVLVRAVEPGDAVQPGRVLIELALDGPVELRAFPDERALARLRIGQRAVASADAYSEKTFPASVTWIAPVIDPRQGTVEVRLAVPSPPSYLLPDMTVSVNIELDRRATAATISIEAVRAPLTDTAWVLAVRDGRARRVTVGIGIRSDRLVEIIAGLEEGEPVIVNGGGVRPGDRVRVRNSR